ncbi:conserved hypothetical protein [Theileria orientalis strain Shintoku]|uniref:Lon N-terminal domain-containing protein n=1 Tax=Theileria orientalis strain Shintoku TaxID=869250 RepID=J4DNG0_THEOR|nr:conserved hypothetical protein [Theileria orientalis strain Shintoku]PVC52679.1 hypothetical protein MACL_00000591 [Theileria orientalis]BAM38894.1 conserved hypothetical protein [Theileria orientalis strain Shintoku]|eukprot:XP_009689195.1 conserved hypothetical protein [Theileria orientalis strain Shintoku]
MYMCKVLSVFCYFVLYVLIANNVNISTRVECIYRNTRLTCLKSPLSFIPSNLQRKSLNRKSQPLKVTRVLSRLKDDLSIDPENLNLSGNENDYKSVSERMEKENAVYIDNTDHMSELTEGVESSDDNKYFDWDSITKTTETEGSEKSLEENKEYENEEIKTVTTNVDGKSTEDIERGERPALYGSGLNTELNVEEYEIGVSNGRINEWPVEWAPGKKVLSFFPILIDQYSLNPNPLQLGFEDSIRFRGKHVESIFNSIIDKLGEKEVYGLCFLSPESLQLAPLAVYAELISKKVVVDGSGENLIVTGRVLGRVLINRVVLEEPFIKALVSPYEDEPVLKEPENVPKLVDEIVNLYETCNTAEAEIMQLLEQPYAHTRVKNRSKLFDVIDDRLNKFNIENTINQGFAQIAAYAAFDYHLNASERYDALAMQNTEDRLRFVRDTLKFKGKQLSIVKNSPKERLTDLVKQLKNFQNNRDSIYNFQDQNEVSAKTKEDVAVGNNQPAEEPK